MSGRISTLARWIAGAGLLLMTGIVALQVFARYVLNASPPWAEQAALLLMIWYVFIAAAAGVREGFHIRISVFADALPSAVRRPVMLLAHAVVLVFGAAMVVYGVELARETWQHTIPTLGLSRGWAYIPIALSGVLIAGFSLEQLIATWRGREVSKLW
ncbi:MAG: TRAP transporter small permease, partial [Pseudomonadota bacterium]